MSTFLSFISYTVLYMIIIQLPGGECHQLSLLDSRKPLVEKSNTGPFKPENWNKGFGGGVTGISSFFVIFVQKEFSHLFFISPRGQRPLRNLCLTLLFVLLLAFPRGPKPFANIVYVFCFLFTSIMLWLCKSMFCPLQVPTAKGRYQVS